MWSAALRLGPATRRTALTTHTVTHARRTAMAPDQDAGRRARDGKGQGTPRQAGGGAGGGWKVQLTEGHGGRRPLSTPQCGLAVGDCCRLSGLTSRNLNVSAPNLRLTLDRLQLANQSHCWWA